MTGRERGARSVPAWIGLGGNMGDRLATLREAIGRLGALGEVRAVSPVYETAPVGFLDQPAFLNAAVEVETGLAPDALVTALLTIEREMGRVRSFANAPRTIDLDLLLYDGVVLDSAHVTVPHPRLHERAFVLAPLADIAPDLMHPVIGVSIGDLLTRLEPVSGVRRVPGSPMP